jgi:hypothetical protein
MLAKVYSCVVMGLDGAIVEVEVDTANDLPYAVQDTGSVSNYRSSGRWLGCGPRKKNAANSRHSKALDDGSALLNLWA